MAKLARTISKTFKCSENFFKACENGSLNYVVISRTINGMLTKASGAIKSNFFSIKYTRMEKVRAMTVKFLKDKIICNQLLNALIDIYIVEQSAKIKISQF